MSFVDASKIRHKRDPGRCYRRAGWTHAGFTKGGLYAFQLLPQDMPPPSHLGLFLFPENALAGTQAPMSDLEGWMET